MTGTITAQFVIPIVAFLLLVFWVSLVYYADSHPYWGGRRAVSQQQLMTQLPNLAEVMGAGPAAAVPGLPATVTVPSPAQPERAAQPSPTVPAQRRPARAGQPGPATGATAAAGRSPARNP
jgi:hypothetical protein